MGAEATVQTGNVSATLDPSTNARDWLEASVEVNASPFCQEQIRHTSERLRIELDVAATRAQLKASRFATVELFCLLAQNAPEVLPPSWALVYDMLVAEERFWVYPRMTLADIEEGACDAFTPYLDRSKLASEWQDLLAHVGQVLSVQDSAKRHALTA